MRSFAKDGLMTFGLSALARALGIAVGVVLARALGQAGKGEVAYAAIALELFVVAIGGIAQAASVQYRRNGVPGGAVYGAMLRIVAAISLPACVILAVVAVCVPAEHVLLWAAIAVPFATYGEATIGLLLGAQQIGAINVQRALSTTGFNLAAIVALLLFHAHVEIVLTLWVAGYIAGALYAARAVRPFVREGVTTPELVRAQSSFALKASSAGVAGYINMRIDVVVVSLMLGATALGNYTLAVTTAEFLWQLSQPFCWAGLGRVTAEPLDVAAAFVAKLTRHIIALIIPIGVVLFIAGPWLIPLVYGHNFAPAAGALRWILPGVIAYAIEVPLGYFLMVKLGRPMLIVAIQSVSIVLCAAITAATVRRWGIDGAAAATSITYICVVIAKATVFVRATGTPLRDLVLLNGADLDRLLASKRLAPFTGRLRTRLLAGLR